MRDKLDHLLRAGAPQPESAPEMPLGLDTRVVALARSQRAETARDAWEIARLMRRSAIAAAIVILFSSGAAYWQIAQNDETDDALTDAYAIADTAIAGEFLP